MPEFWMSNEKVEIVNSFKYLGLKFTVRLSFSEHLNECCSKAQSRSAFLFNKLPLGEFGLEMVPSYESFPDSHRTYLHIRISSCLGFSEQE